MLDAETGLVSVFSAGVCRMEPADRCHGRWTWELWHSHSLSFCSSQAHRPAGCHSARRWVCDVLEKEDSIVVSWCASTRCLCVILCAYVCVCWCVSVLLRFCEVHSWLCTREKWNQPSLTDSTQQHPLSAMMRLLQNLILATTFTHSTHTEIIVLVKMCTWRK